MPKFLGERTTDSPEAPAAIFQDDDFATGTALFSTSTVAPTTFVTPIVVDTVAKHAYVWDGTAYVKISDYA